jgi:hypothetical protein
MVLHPVGPLPPSTYWRRRVVLLGLLVVVVLLLRSCAGGESPQRTASPGGTPTPTRTATAKTTPAPSPTKPAAPGTCEDAALRLTSRTDARTYPEGVAPRVTVTVVNTSGTTCRRDLGGKALEVLVYSGEDRIWSSDDCSADTSSSVQTLKAGAMLETSVTWPRTRSAKGCPADRPKARGGTYVVRVRLGTLAGERTVLTLNG